MNCDIPTYWITAFIIIFLVCVFAAAANDALSHRERKKSEGDL
uniref:Uncharacterized protein n=4 Tax=unclassified bacterial viruses TaxID=12333 RepID=A0AAU6W347_9VIRU